MEEFFGTSIVQNLKVIFDSNVLAFAVFNSKEEMIYCNDAALKILDLTRKPSEQPVMYPEWGRKFYDQHDHLLSLEQLPMKVIFAEHSAVHSVQYQLVGADGLRHYICLSGIVFSSPGKTEELGALIFHDVGKTIAIQESLRRNRDDLQMILDLMPAMVFYKDTKNMMLRVNRVAASAKGVSPAEMENTPTERWYPEEAAKYYQDDLDVIRSGRPKLGIVEQHEISSRKIWVKTDKFPYYDEHGKIIGVVVFAVDITKEKEAEDRLRESEELFRSLFENALLSILVVSPRGVIERCNDAFGAFVGQARETLQGQVLLDYVFEKDQPHFQRIFDVSSQGDFECRFLRPGGGVTWGRVTANWICEPCDTPRYAVLMIHNISARKLAEQNLRQSEERFRLFFDRASVGLVIYTLEGRNISFNNSLCEMMGYSRAEMERLTLFDLTYAEDIEMSRQVYERIRHEKLVNVEYEKRYVRKDGRIFWAKVVVVWNFDDEGNPLYGFAMVEDIDSRRRDTEQIQLNQTLLQKRVEERTLELEKKNLALRELLGQIEIEKIQMQQNVLANIEQVVLPVLSKIRRRVSAQDRKQVDLLENNLAGITSGFGQKLSLARYRMTPKEIQICDLIRKGMSNKEISVMCNLSLRTIENHRNNIRSKLGLAHQKINLMSFLKSF